MSAVYRGTFADASLLSQQQAAVQRVLHAQEQARRVLENAEATAPNTPFIPAGTPVFTPNMPRPQEQFQNDNLLSHLFGNRPNQNQVQPENKFASAQAQSGTGQPFNAQAHPSGRGNMPPFAQGVGRQGATGGGRGLLDLLGSLTSKIPGVSTTGSTASSLGDSLKSTLSSVSQPLASLLDTFDIDGEKLIILMVMWVIFNERGDKTLLLALGYLLF